MVRAIVREDVRSLDGGRVLIPKGSRLVGNTSPAWPAAKRIFIVWSRVIRSDGVSVEIASPGADRLGRAGLTGEIDAHFWERFGSAIMLSVIGGAAEYVSALGDTATGSARSISTVDPLTGAVTTVTTEPSRTAAEARSIAAEKSSAVLQDIANRNLQGKLEDSADDLCRAGRVDHRLPQARSRLLRLLCRPGPAGDDAAQARWPDPAQCRPDALLSDRAGLQMKQFPFLDKALERLKPFLSDDRVSEISVNRPGEVFIELGVAGMERVVDAQFTADWIRT